MNNNSGKTISLWMDTKNIPPASALDKNIFADVCVVGAGIAGLTTAYLLSKEGKSVVVLEAGQVAGGESGRTTAHLVNAFDDRFFRMEKYHGSEAIKILADSHSSAISKIEEIVNEENIDCDLIRLDGYLFPAKGESADTLHKELDAIHRAGIKDAVITDHSPVPSLTSGPCLKFPSQGQFHPMKYFAGLVKGILANGGKIFTDTKAISIKGGGKAIVKTANNFMVTAASVVVATNTPVNNRVVIHTKQAPYRTYVVTAKIPKNSVPTALYWDTADPYHYIRLQQSDPGHDYLIIGGEDHKTGQEKNPKERLRCLEEWSREKFPMIEEITHRWSGQVMEPVDGVAFIGRNPDDKENVFIITGDSGNGMTHGTIGGILITDMIMGRENKWAALYDPSRITLKSAGEFVKENINVAVQYAKWLQGSEEESTREIAKESGAIMEDGNKKIAVYKDENGSVHVCSAACTHLGCVVNWNDVEKSWDCPCHGSRFDGMGKVISAPAINDLGKIKDEDSSMDIRKPVKRKSGRKGVKK